MGDYILKNHMFSIAMGGFDIVLGVEWLCTLRQITMDYQELYMIFTQEAHTYSLHGLHVGSPKIINFHIMEKLLNKSHHTVIAQFNSIQVQETSSPTIHLDLQLVLDKHHWVFQTPMELPPSRGEHDHSIPLLSGSHPPNVCPYRYPFSQKNEIEKMVQKLLEKGVILPSTSPYSSPVMMVLKK
jgi:hypothetical protein